ncbi:hypothetical protein C8Q74DRAFT_822134 [Fomes fomentarius]|nr:hypothetical protein C8Q74DRAFT_822134 [Fomes fomentarius]
MRREEPNPRSRHDVDDRWRMADTGDRYSYDRRDDQRRVGDSHDERDEGWSRRGHSDDNVGWTPASRHDDRAGGYGRSSQDSRSRPHNGHSRYDSRSDRKEGSPERQRDNGWETRRQSTAGQSWDDPRGWSSNHGESSNREDRSWEPAASWQPGRREGARVRIHTSDIRTRVSPRIRTRGSRRAATSSSSNHNSNYSKNAAGATMTVN